MDPSSTPSKPAPAAAAVDHVAFQNESSQVTSSLPTKMGTMPAVPRGVFIGALLVAAVLPAILVGAIVTLLMAANFNLLNWME